MEFLARVLVHIPDKGHVTTRYYSWYANRPRGMREDPEQGRVQSQFELVVSRYSAGGLKENRYLVVRIEVAKRNGIPELIDKSLGPLTQSSRR